MRLYFTFFIGLIATLALMADFALAQESRARRGAPGATPAQQELESYLGGPRDQDHRGSQTQAVSVDADECTDKKHCSNVVTSGRLNDNRRQIQQRVELYLRGEADKATPQRSKAVQ